MEQEDIRWKAEIEFNRALRAAQEAAGGGPPFNETFESDGRNTGKASFSFRYTSAQKVTEWGRKILNSNGLSLSPSGHATVEMHDGIAPFINVGWKLRHAMGHSEFFSVPYPVTVPAGGTLVRGTTASRTTLIKTAILDVLCARGDENANDEEMHAEVVPAGISLPPPIGIPGGALPIPLPPPAQIAAAPAAGTSSRAPDSAPSAAPSAAPSGGASAAPTAAEASKGSTASPTTPANGEKLAPIAQVGTGPDVAGAFLRLKGALAKLPKEKKLPELEKLNESLSRTGRFAAVAPNGNLIRGLEPADVSAIMTRAYEIEASVGGNGASPSASPAAASPSVPSVASSAPAATEASAATDAGLKGRLDSWFGKAKAAREKKKEEREPFNAKVNAAAGSVVIDSTYDDARFTETVINRLETFIASYGA